MFQSNMLLQLFLRIVDVLFMAGSLARPDDCMLPFHMTEPFVGSLEENISFITLFEKTYIRVNVL